MDTWQISFDYVQRSRPSAAGILSRASFCDRQGIPETLLRTYPEPRNDNDSISSDDFEDDLQLLRDFLFISQNADGRTFEMHRLVQSATRNWLRTHGDFEDCQAQFLKSLDTNFLENPNLDWEASRILVPHVQAAYMQRPAAEDALADWANLLVWGYRYLIKQRADGETLEMIQAAYNARQAVLGPNHHSTLACRMMMGLSHGGRLGLEEQETILEEVIECAAIFYGPESPEAIRTMPYLAEAYIEKGRFSDAETVLRKVLEVETKLSFIMWIDPRFGYRDLGERPSGLVRRDEDQAEVIQALLFGDSKLETYDYDWPIFNAKIALAELCLEQSRWEEAGNFYHQALSNKLLGPASSQRTSIMRGLTEVYWKQRKWKEAESVFQQSLDLDMGISGPGYNHSMSFSCMQRLSDEYCKLGMLLEAEVFQRNWLEKLRKLLGNEHSGIMKMMIQLAVIYNKQGRGPEARELVFEVLEVYEMTKDGGHLDTLDFAKLREVCLGQHLWKEVEAAEVRIIEEMKRMFGPDHEETKEKRDLIMREREEFKDKRITYPEGA